jgi:hypothetical protein
MLAWQESGRKNGLRIRRPFANVIRALVADEAQRGWIFEKRSLITFQLIESRILAM